MVHVLHVTNHMSHARCCMPTVAAMAAPPANSPTMYTLHSPSKQAVHFSYLQIEVIGKLELEVQELQRDGTRKVYWLILTWIKYHDCRTRRLGS